MIETNEEIRGLQYILKLFYFYLEDYIRDNPRDDEYLSDSPTFNITEFTRINRYTIDTFLLEVKKENSSGV